MIFVPLPLFASLTLAFVGLRFVTTRDMRQPAHRLFALLVAGYVAQSVLLVMRWGYGMDGLGTAIAHLAPVLPAVAVSAFLALDGTERAPLGRLWPWGSVAACWLVYWVAFEWADVLILLVYLGMGGFLLWRGIAGEPSLALSPLADTAHIRRAMIWTGGVLVAAGVTDIVVLVDFIRTGGANVGLIVTVTQTGFVLVIAAAAGFARVTSEAPTAQQPAGRADLDETEARALLQRLDGLFRTQALHRDEDLSLRKLARKLGVPDRQVSQAINGVGGVNVSQFVNEYRINEACDLLANSDASVLAVSLQVGFASKSNFNREFARVTGKSPSEWRREAPGK